MQSLCLEFRNISNCYNCQFFNPKQYYNIMKTMTFLGVSGEVKFSSGTPDRIADHIDSTNWTYYKNKSDSILWPNLSKTIPVDCKLIQGN
ncbi:unnamed protein product [Rotaria sp. Silwood1]|nr:unnamed protein product [Rotaria sp. Silwood1]